MEPVTYRIRLDAGKPGSQETIYAKRGDAKSRKITAYLTNGAAPFPMSSSVSAILHAIKPDGTVVFNTANVEENGAVSIILTSGMLAQLAVFPASCRLLALMANC